MSGLVWASHVTRAVHVIDGVLYGLFCCAILAGHASGMLGV